MVSFLSFSAYALLLFRALHYAIEGCGPKFEPFITTDLLQVIFRTLGHANRFVRETGFKVIGSMIKSPDVSEATIESHWPKVAQSLARGLADNWSQVCMFLHICNNVHIIYYI